MKLNHLFRKGLSPAVALTLLFWCAKPTQHAGGASETESMGKVRVIAFDKPPSLILDSVVLDVQEIHAGKDSLWVLMSRPCRRYDFLRLTNGEMATLADTALAAESFSQLRIVLGDLNTVSVGGQVYALQKPAKAPFDVKVNIGFTPARGETLDLYLDFNASASVRLGPNGYVLAPVFKAFPRTLSGIISGAVSDRNGERISRALIQACGESDTATTYSVSSGGYLMILPEGIYTLFAEHNGIRSDTVYTNVFVSKGNRLSGIDFKIP